MIETKTDIDLLNIENEARAVFNELWKESFYGGFGDDYNPKEKRYTLLQPRLPCLVDNDLRQTLKGLGLSADEIDAEVKTALDEMQWKRYGSCVSQWTIDGVELFVCLSFFCSFVVAYEVADDEDR